MLGEVSMIALQAGGDADISWLHGSISAGGWRALAIGSLFAAEIPANRAATISALHALRVE
jgi:hypothetical protein